MAVTAVIESVPIFINPTIDKNINPNVPKIIAKLGLFIPIIIIPIIKKIPQRIPSNPIEL